MEIACSVLFLGRQLREIGHVSVTEVVEHWGEFLLDECDLLLRISVNVGIGHSCSSLGLVHLGGFLTFTAELSEPLFSVSTFK